jgi:pilus assembly protein Flp/PilA
MTFLKDENGQGMVEYGLILGLIAIVAIVLVVALGGKVKGIFSKANTDLTTEAAA